MRIIAGEARGRRLRPVRGRQVRPTADRVREALFSLLEARRPAGLAGSRVLDLYAGTGALGIEALSRGARAAVFVESDREAARTVRENLESCGFAERARLVVKPVEVFLQATAAESEPRPDLIFLDPPYDSGLETPALELLGHGLVAAAAVVVVEHPVRRPPPEEAGDLRRFRERTYGQSALSFYSLKSTSSS